MLRLLLKLIIFIVLLPVHIYNTIKKTTKNIKAINTTSITTLVAEAHNEIDNNKRTIVETYNKSKDNIKKEVTNIKEVYTKVRLQK